MEQPNSGLPSSDVLMSQNLSDSQSHVVNAALDLLRGRATTVERSSMLEATSDYGDKLYQDGLNLLGCEIKTGDDETHGRELFIDFLLGSISGIVSNAEYLHYTESRLERMRFFFEQTKIRRYVASIAIASAAGGLSNGLFKAVNSVPRVDEFYSSVSGITLAAIFFKVMGPRTIVKKILQLPADRVSDRAKDSIDKNDIDKLENIHQRTKKIIQMTQSKEVGRRKSFELISRELYMNEVRSALRDLLGPKNLVTKEDQHTQALAASKEVVGWLNAFYGVDEHDYDPKTEPEFMKYLVNKVRPV